MLTKKDRIRKWYKRLTNAVRSGSSASRPVFVLGEMRSGTNMLVECLDRSLATKVFNETDDEAFDGYALRNNRKIGDLIEQSPASHVIFKSLADSARASELLSTFSGSKAVWIYRRYEDVVNSALRKWNEHNKYLHDILYDTSRAKWRAVNVSDDAKQLIKYHYERGLSESSARALIWYIRNRHFFEQDLQSNIAVRLLSYEDLVQEPTEHLKVIFKFIGLEFRDSFVQHVTTSSVRKFDPPEIDPNILDLCRSLKADLDNLWTAQRKFSVSES